MTAHPDTPEARARARAAVREAIASGRITTSDVDEALNIYHDALSLPPRSLSGFLDPTAAATGRGVTPSRPGPFPFGSALILRPICPASRVDASSVVPRSDHYHGTEANPERAARRSREIDTWQRERAARQPAQTFEAVS